ncbi:MAG: hypothetical protein RB191_19970, partial [Terriglobia bacterium]|nr:hypothetical protein [Terriglobia bacterium]
GQGGSGYIPPGLTMLKSQVTIAAPSYKRVTLSGYGATVFTTGALYGLKVTGGFMGGLVVKGLEFDNSTDSLSLGGITFFGSQNCYAFECWNRISSTIASDPGYALVVLQPSDPTNDGTGPIWNKVLRCGTRQSSGNASFYAPYAVRLLGAANATEIAGCSFESCHQFIGVSNQVSAGGTGTIANGCIVHDNAFEGATSALVVDGNSSSAVGATFTGWKIYANRFEGITGQAYLFQNLTADAAVPPEIFGNYYESSVPLYITQNNVGGLQITVNTDDPSFTPAYPLGIVFTAAPTGTGGNLSSAWARATGQWQIRFSDSETLQGSFTNGSIAVTWPTAISGAPTVNASVITGDMTDVTGNGPRNVTSVAGDAQILTAASEYGLAGGTSAGHNYRLRSRSGGGGYAQFPNLGDLRGIDGLGHAAGVRRKNFIVNIVFTASASGTATFGTAEPDTNYVIVPIPNATTGVVTMGAAGTGSCAFTAANSNSQTIKGILIGL